MMGSGTIGATRWRARTHVAQEEDVVMGTIDFAPLFRSTVGFDRLFDLVDRAAHLEAVDDYPPCNIAKIGEDTYRISMAVAGFAADELSITAQPNLLVVAGRKANQDDTRYLHHGLAMRA